VLALFVGAGYSAQQASAATSSETGAESAAPGGVAGSDRDVTLQVGGVWRSYRLFVPDQLPARPRLVVFLHGFGSSPQELEVWTGFDQQAVGAGAVVAYPAAQDSRWEAGGCCLAGSTATDDLAFIAGVVADVEQRFSLDQTKIAIGGYSNGALMTYRLACETPGIARIFFAVAGTDEDAGCAFSTAVSLAEFHGLADPVVPWLGGTSTLQTLFSGPVAPVPDGLHALAAADRCTGWTSTTPDPGVTSWNALGCSTGSAVSALTVDTLDHHWATGSSDLATYGVDETSAVWSWITSRWAQPVVTPHVLATSLTRITHIPRRMHQSRHWASRKVL
jgi:polyhydroxybutyrate depolymerase